MVWAKDRIQWTLKQLVEAIVGYFKIFSPNSPGVGTENEANLEFLNTSQKNYQLSYVLRGPDVFKFLRYKFTHLVS